MPRSSKRVVLRGKLWIEIAGKSALTEAGADLLEQIEICGSLSEAARRLHFAYRRAWLLMDAMNTHWPKPVAILSTGGQRGGGAKLTALGKHILHTYRDLQIQLEHLLDSAGNPFEPGPG
jgi:molybdate transport system regulatory protein